MNEERTERQRLNDEVERILDRMEVLIKQKRFETAKKLSVKADDLLVKIKTLRLTEELRKPS
jgi:hypothetical protein